MDSVDFAIQTAENEQIKPLLKDIAKQVEQDVHFEQGEKFEIGITSAAIMLASLALYRWMTNYFDQQRNLNETEITKRRAELIKELVEEDTVSLEQATAAVTAIIDQLAKRGENDSAVKAVRELLGLS